MNGKLTLTFASSPFSSRADKATVSPSRCRQAGHSLTPDAQAAGEPRGEIAILRAISHEHIVSLSDCIKTDAHIYLIMAFCAWGDLSMYIKSHGQLPGKPDDPIYSSHDLSASIMPAAPTSSHHSPSASAVSLPPGTSAALLRELWESVAHFQHPTDGGLNDYVVRSFLWQLTSALRFMRGKDIVHRDLKPQNLLLQPADAAFLATGHPRGIPQVKVADFGFARHLPAASLAETLCGSPLYMAPEILRYEKYDAKADLWSVGAVTFEMCVGRPPFHASNHIQLLERIQRAERRALEIPGEERVKFPDERPEAKYVEDEARRAAREGRAVVPIEKLRLELPHRVSDDLKRVVRLLLKANSVERASFDELFDHPAVKSGSGPQLAEALRAAGHPAAAAAQSASALTASASNASIQSAASRQSSGSVSGSVSRRTSQSKHPSLSEQQSSASGRPAAAAAGGIATPDRMLPKMQRQASGDASAAQPPARTAIVRLPSSGTATPAQAQPQQPAPAPLQRSPSGRAGQKPVTATSRSRQGSVPPSPTTATPGIPLSQQQQQQVAQRTDALGTKWGFAPKYVVTSGISAGAAAAAAAAASGKPATAHSDAHTAGSTATTASPGTTDLVRPPPSNASSGHPSPRLSNATSIPLGAFDRRSSGSLYANATVPRRMTIRQPSLDGGHGADPSSVEDNAVATPSSGSFNFNANVRVARQDDAGAAGSGSGSAPRSAEGSLLGGEYAIVEKRNVEVNSLADELAASPTQRLPIAALQRRPSRLARLGSGQAATAAAFMQGPSSLGRTGGAGMLSLSPITAREASDFSQPNSSAGTPQLSESPRSRPWPIPSAPFAIPPGQRPASFQRRTSLSSSGSPSPSLQHQSLPPVGGLSLRSASFRSGPSPVGGGASRDPLASHSPDNLIEAQARPTTSLSSSPTPSPYRVPPGTWTSYSGASVTSPHSSALSRAINMASVRLFGVPSGVTLRNAAMLVRSRSFRRLSSNASGEGPDPAELRLLNQLEDFGQKSFVLSEFADSKLAMHFAEGPHQIGSSTQSDAASVVVGSYGRADVRGARRDASSSVHSSSLGTDSAVTAESAAAEALMLYAKSLSYLQRAIDLTRTFVDARSQSGYHTGASPEVTETVQWLRARFNEGCEKVDFARARCGELTTSTQAIDKIIFDKALEIARAAAVDELENNREGADWDSARCLLAYETASSMLLGLLDPGEESLALSTTSIATVEKCECSLLGRVYVDYLMTRMC